MKYISVYKELGIQKGIPYFKKVHNKSI